MARCFQSVRARAGRVLDGINKTEFKNMGYEVAAVMVWGYDITCDECGVYDNNVLPDELEDGWIISGVFNDVQEVVEYPSPGFELSSESVLCPECANAEVEIPSLLDIGLASCKRRGVPTSELPLELEERVVDGKIEHRHKRIKTKL